jgi:hypothetical protein
LLGFAALNPTYKQAHSLYFKRLIVFSVERSASAFLGGEFMLTLSLLSLSYTQKLKQKPNLKDKSILPPRSAEALRAHRGVTKSL